jgi:hypothetical protein
MNGRGFITISMHELERVKIIEAVVQHRLTIVLAAERLQLCERQVSRLVQRYQAAGVAGLVSGKRGRAGNHQLPDGMARRSLATLVTFAAGIIGTGFLTLPVLAISGAYAMGERLTWPVGLARLPLQAKALYGVIAAATAIAAKVPTQADHVISPSSLSPYSSSSRCDPNVRQVRRY